MISVEQALLLIDQHASATDKVLHKTLDEAPGHVLAQDVFFPADLPALGRATTNGYALCLHDSVAYSVVEATGAEAESLPCLKAGEALRVANGALLPESCQAVVMHDELRLAHGRGVLEARPEPGENIRRRTAPIKKGERALEKGRRVNAAAVGLLRSLGLTRVPVFASPSIGLLSTGSQGATSRTPLQIGQIFRSNALMLRSALAEHGFGDTASYPLTGDFRQTCHTLRQALRRHDVLVISEGAAAGDYERLGAALEYLGVQTVFHHVNQNPGKPLYFGKKDDRLVFGLQGNPSSSLTCFYIYLLSALYKFKHLKPPMQRKKTSLLDHCIRKTGKKANFLKAKLTKTGVRSLHGQSSSMLKSFSLSNALLYLPEEKRYFRKGDEVEVITFSSAHS